MHIALTVNYSPWSPYSGGGQRSTHSLACALSRAGHRVDVVYTRPPWERVRTPARLPYRVHWATLPAVRSRRGAALRPLSSFSVAAKLEEIKPEVVHANGEEAALVALHRKAFDGPFVVTPRYPSFPDAMGDGSWRRVAGRLKHLLRHPKYAALGVALSGADRACPTSHDAASTLNRVFGTRPQRMRVVPNGVERIYFEHRWSPPAHERLLYFGRFAEEKGVFDLLGALGRMKDPPPTTFVGRGDALVGMRARAQTLGLRPRVEFVDWASPARLCERIASASLVVVPSWEESFGNTVAEAMAVGAPLVTTTAGAIPELVEHDRTAVMAPAKDPAALAAAIERVRAEPSLAQQLGTRARAVARSRFTWDEVAASYTKVYGEIPR